MAYFMNTQIAASTCFIINILPQRFTINIFFNNADTYIIFFNIVNNGNSRMIEILQKCGFRRR